ncbi:MAG: hypothetical protein R3335_13240, partial [Anaerolineales bacterium]|nr:hypothetical protein [Anaerolineales bacterium]
APSGWVLFQDAFNDPESGWIESDDPDGRRGYADGAYRFTIQRANWYYWASPRLRFSDIHVDVEITRLGGDGVSAQGIFCRFQDEGNFYAFTISSDGYTGISKFVDGQETLLGEKVLKANADIIQGDARNFVGVDCIDDQLRMWVNGVEALAVRDSSYATGEAGIIGAVLEGESAVIEFDNFSIIKP